MLYAKEAASHDYDLSLENQQGSLDISEIETDLNAAFSCAGTFGCAGSFGGTAGSFGTFGCASL